MIFLLRLFAERDNQSSERCLVAVVHPTPLTPGGIHLLMTDLHSALVLRLRSEVPMK